MNGSRPKALLIQPPIYDFALYDLFHQPFGLMRIATWLDRTGYEVTILDCLDIVDPGHTARQVRRRHGTGKFLRQVVETPAPLRSVRRRYARYGIGAPPMVKRIRDATPDVVLIGTGMTYWYEGCREAAIAVRELFPDVPVIAGGIYATLLPSHCAEQLETDLVVKGNADPALCSVLRGLELPCPTGPVPYQPDRNSSSGSNRLREAGVLRLNEGCPYSCDYCASHLLRPGFTAGDTESLLQSLEEMHAAGIRHIAFYDDALLHRSELALVPFLEKVIRRFGRREISLYVPNAVHAGEINPPIAELMFGAGFREVRLGIESDDKEFHRTHGYKIDVDALRECAVSLRSAGFTGSQITGYLLAGVPGTSAVEFSRSLDTVESLGMRISIAEYSPVPGTRLFDAACQQSELPLRGEPLCHNNSILPTASPEFSMGDLRRMRERVTRHNRTLRCATM